MRFVASWALLLVGGCVADVGELCGGPLYEVTEPVVVPRSADVLFVVDNSRSMAEEQEALARSFGRFIDAVAGSGEYRIGVITTDMSFDFDDEGEVGGYSEFIYDVRHPHGIVGVDDQQCAPLVPRTEHGCFRGRGAERFVDSTMGDRNAQIARFAQNVRVGTCGSGLEQAFQALIRALDEREGCNQGFFRDDANLVIIFVSDEDDNGQEPIALYAEELARRVDLRRTRIAAVIGAVDGEASYCNPDTAEVCGNFCAEVNPNGSGFPCSFATSGTCPFGEICLPMGAGQEPRCVFDDEGATFCASCSRFMTDGCCSAEPGRRYVELAREIERRTVAANPELVATGCSGGADSLCLVDTICATDFGDTLARIARDLVASTDYTLVPPVEGPRRMVVDLVGPRFDDGERRLKIDTDYRLSDDGSTVSILIPTEPEDTVRIRYRNSIDIPGMNCLPN
ncbi:MAG: vWA domain-containing protein [Deltaproteobacteria bacterium]